MYSVFEQLLQKNGISTYKVSKDTGIAQSVFSSWKNGISKPKQDKMKILADYFNVSVEYLMTGEEKESGEKYYLNDETAEIAQEIFENKYLKMLFDVTKNASPQRLKAYYNMIKEIEKEENYREDWFTLPEVNVIIMDNPFGVKGSVHKNSDGSYTIIINARLNREQQIKVYEHEMKHILFDDFGKSNVQLIESEAHKWAY